MRMRTRLSTLVGVALVVVPLVAMPGEALATGDLTGTFSAPGGAGTAVSLETFTDGSTVSATVSGSDLEIWNSSACMKQTGGQNGGVCNWGGMGGQTAPDFTNVYSTDAVKDLSGMGLRFSGTAMQGKCQVVPVVNGVYQALSPAYCNSGNSVGTLTFTFSQPQTSATLHLNNVGGSGGFNWLANLTGTVHTNNEWLSFWPIFEVTSPGVSIASPSSRGNFQVGVSTIGVAQPVGTGLDPSVQFGNVWGYPLPYAPGYQVTNTTLHNTTDYTWGAGSVTFTSGTPFTTLTMNVKYQIQLLSYQVNSAPGVPTAGTPPNGAISYDPGTMGDSTAFYWTIPATSGGSGGGSGSGSNSSTPSLPEIAAMDSSYTTPFNTSISVPASNGALANDTGYAIQVAQSGQPANGTAVVNPNGSFTYTPNNGFFGTDCWPYVISDPYGQSARAQLCVTVPKPTISAVDDYYSTPYETPLSGNAAPTDTYPAGSTFRQTGSPAHGTAVMKSDGSFVYTPDRRFSGRDNFPYTVCMPAPNQGLCASAVEYITVPGPNDPMATPELIVVKPGSLAPVPFDPMIFSRASGGQTLVRGASVICPLPNGKCGSVVIVPGKGTWRVRQGKVIFTPVAGFIGQSTVRYRVTDSSGKTAASTFTVITKSAPTSVHGGVA